MTLINLLSGSDSCGSRMSGYFCSLGISKYVIWLHLSKLLSNMTIGMNFLSKCIFVSEYFRAERCCKISEPESVKKISEWTRIGKISHSAML